MTGRERRRNMKYYIDIDGIELDQFNELMGDLGYYDDRVYNMDDFDEMVDVDGFDAILKAFNGSRFGYVNDSFNPNDGYFTFDGYDNLVSINRYYLQEYFDMFKYEILEYVNNNEIYLDGVDEYDDDDDDDDDDEY